MEKDEIFTGDDVRDAVAVVGDGPETSAGRDAVGMFGQIEFRRLSVRRLRRRQSPRLAEHLLEEGWVDFEVFGNDVEAKQVTVDAFAAHGVLVASLVLDAGQFKQSNPFLALSAAHMHRERKRLNRKKKNKKEVVNEKRSDQGRRRAGRKVSTYADGLIVHRLDPLTRLDRTRTDSFRAAFAEQTSHTGFVRQTEFARILQKSSKTQIKL